MAAHRRKRGLPKPGYLYFIQVGGERGPIKIGHSVDVDDRLKTITTSNPERPVLLAKFKCETPEDARAFEQQLHRSVFWDLRRHGEWFEFDARILRLIREMQLVELRCGTTKDETIRIRSIDERGEDFA